MHGQTNTGNSLLKIVKNPSKQYAWTMSQEVQDKLLRARDLRNTSGLETEALHLELEALILDGGKYAASVGKIIAGRQLRKKAGNLYAKAHELKYQIRSWWSEGTGPKIGELLDLKDQAERTRRQGEQIEDVGNTELGNLILTDIGYKTEERTKLTMAITKVKEGEKSNGHVKTKGL